MRGREASLTISRSCELDRTIRVWSEENSKAVPAHGLSERQDKRNSIRMETKSKGQYMSWLIINDTCSTLAQHNYTSMIYFSSLCTAEHTKKCDTSVQDRHTWPPSRCGDGLCRNPRRTPSASSPAHLKVRGQTGKTGSGFRWTDEEVGEVHRPIAPKRERRTSTA
eukprot:768475-Hanusia_phi.AAC.3